jgi:CRP-like cAMP-binding protein
MILLYSMRTPNFDTFEELVHGLKFSDLKHHEVAPIFKLAQRRSLADGEVLLNDGDNNSCLFLIVEGGFRIMKNGTEITLLEPGEFVGELSFISGDEISADVISAGNTEIMYWDRLALEPLFKRHGLYKPYLHALCSVDIAQKLRRMTAATAEAG